ncbi:DUF6376 family protein [Halobacillus litoralis]|uniref:DUF6376 family protein n=1 Tax=Halobacillus litoralis TaxID=45668 RepID=UPI001CD4DC52|nr:DUF6376 family protein [Halobacillus litoralis]MCA0969045.1 DUF6376 family protein [Halobacillus litoralis]
MKKWTGVTVFILIGTLLSGCSFLNDVNNTLNYADEAQEYANEASAFMNEAPALVEQAVNDPDKLSELETLLEEMKSDIEEFNGLEAPNVGGDLHQQVVDYNNQALQGIDVYLENMENGSLDPEVVRNTDAFQSFEEVRSIIDQVQQLSQ